MFESHKKFYFQTIVHSPAENLLAVMLLLHHKGDLTHSLEVGAKSLTVLLHLLAAQTPPEVRNWFSPSGAAGHGDLGSGSEGLLIVSRH